MSLTQTQVRSSALLPIIGPGLLQNTVCVADANHPRPFAYTAWYSLFWLVLANAVGVLLGILLLLPNLNRVLGTWTYGRWMPVHMNLELYGWASLPLVAFLFKVYGSDRGPAANWCRPVLWAWSAALGVGVL